MSHVEAAAPSVPQMKKGAERREAAGPKVFEKRETLAGKIHDVPNPAMPAPIPKNSSELATTVITTPARTVIKPSISILFSLRKRKSTGATPRPATKNTK